jgi:hypothetical protein
MDMIEDGLCLGLTPVIFGRDPAAIKEVLRKHLDRINIGILKNKILGGGFEGKQR